MEEGQERDSSSDEQRHIIDDDDMEDSPTYSPDLWMPERNEADTMFERALRDAIPSKKHPQVVSELSIVQQRKKLFKDLVKGGNETLTSSVADQCLRDAVLTSSVTDGYQRKAWTVRLPDPSRSQACEVCTLEDPDEWWTYQRRIGNSFPLLYEV
jgi:hypothetical protein